MQIYIRYKLALVATLIMVIVGSCSKESTADLSDLLSTVPSDASAVIAADLRTMLEKSGSKVSDNKVELSEELKSVIGSISDRQMGDNMRALLSGEAGVAHSFAVCFSEGEDMYLTFMLNDPDAFRKFVETVSGEKFTAIGDVQVCGYTACLANQGWIRVGNTAAVDAGEILKFSRLSENQSFASNDLAKKMLDSDKAIMIWADVEGMLGLLGRSFTDRMMYRTVLSSVFDDAATLWGDVDFNKDKILFSTKVLTSKGNPAKCNFPTSTIDVKTVQGLGGNADVIMAVAISSGLSKQLQKVAASLGGGVEGMYSELLKPLDGTVAVAISDMQGRSDLRMVVTTDGKSPVADLTTQLNAFGTVKRDGKFLRIEGDGNSSGNLSLENDAKKLSGAWVAVLIDGKVLNEYPGDSKSFSSLLFSVNPSGQSLEMKMELTAAENESSMIAFLRALGK